MGQLTSIPTTEDPRYVQRVQLNGVDYLLFFRFNARIGRWFLDITDVSQNPIASGLALVVGSYLMAGFPDSLTPDAIIFVTDTSTDDPQNMGDPGLTELGKRFLLNVIDGL